MSTCSYLHPVDFNQNAINNVIVQNLAVDPPAGSSLPGQIIYNTTDQVFKYFDGTNWVSTSAETTTLIQNVLGSGNKIFDYTNEVGTSVDVFESVTTFDVATAGSATFTSEDNTSTTFTETAVVFTTDGTATGVTQSGTSNHTVDIVLLSSQANNGLSIGADGGLFFNPVEQNVVADIAARDGLTDVQTGELALVTDATADATVDAGGALYTWDGAAWVKIAEFANVEGFKSTYTQNPQAGTLAGRAIGTTDDGDAGTPTVDVEETVTEWDVTTTPGVATYTSEDNTQTSITYVRKVCGNVTTTAGTPTNFVHGLNLADPNDYTISVKLAGEEVGVCSESVDANTISVTTTEAQNLRVCVLG